METSFALWLETRDPELFVILEAEFRRRDRSPAKRGLLAGAATTAALAGLGWWMGAGGEKPKEPVKAPTAIVQPKTIEKKQVVDEGELAKYLGSDKEDIFRYACEQSHNGVNVFPYYVNGKQEGLIARMSMPSTSTAPLSSKSLKDRYNSFVHQVRATMRGRNILKTDSEVPGQGPVKWEIIAIGRDNPNRGEAGMVEIVLYAQKPAGER